MSSRPPADYEVLSPYLLLRELPELASNRVPDQVLKACGGTPLEAWELLEEGVFFFFRQILMLQTIRLGANALFKQEPEGVVLVNRDYNPFAFIYECKARDDGYKMSADDALRYKNYIKKKRQEVRVRYNLPLTHFLIISSSFNGDIETRAADIGCEGIVLCLLSADYMKSLYDRIRTLPFPDIHLIELHRLFCRGIVTDSHITSCLGE